MQSKKLKRLFRAVSAAAVAGGVLIASPVLAQPSATWTGGTDNYNTDTNWSPNTDPTVLDTATFAGAGSGTVNITAPATTNQLLFEGTQVYTINNSSIYNVNGIDALGITNDSTVEQVINNNATGSIFINNEAAIDGGTAGINLTNNGQLVFNGTSNAGTDSTLITNLGVAGPDVLTATSAGLEFNDEAGAGSAIIDNNASDAGAGEVAGNATLNFNGSSNAGAATINNDGGSGTAAGATGGIAILNFNDSSGAGSATINNDGGSGTAAGATGGIAILNFNGTSGADTATITNTGGTGVAAGGTGGIAVTTFNAGTSADGATINNIGGAGDLGTGGDASIVFNDASAGSEGLNATINNTGGNGTGVGGTGGNAYVAFYGTSTAAGATITNSSGTAAVSATAGAAVTSFLGDSTAGTAVITNNAGGATIFTDTSDAGLGVGEDNQARITNNGGYTTFLGASSAGTAHITNVNNGVTYFQGDGLTNNSTAADAVITNGDGVSTGTTAFTLDATAGNAAITNNAGSALTFGDTSDAGIGRTRAIVNNGGVIVFSETADAGSASTAVESEGISIRNDSGTISFTEDSTADDATISNDTAGVVDISGVSGVDNDLRIGSLYGAGNVNLGANDLFLGNLGNDDTISGVISGTGSLTKEGEGTLRLTGINDYTGPTTITDGTLQVDGEITSDTTINNDGLGMVGRLSGTGEITGNLTNNGGRIAPGRGSGALGDSDTYGDLNVTGNTTISGDDSILETRVNGFGDVNRLESTGTLTLDGRVTVELESPSTGGAYLVNNSYTIATGDAGRSGTFDGVDVLNPLDYLDASLEYNPTSALLYLRRNSLDDITAGNGYSRNQRSLLGSYNGALGSGALLSEDNEDLINNFILNGDGALDRASGDALTAFPVASQRVADRFNERMRAQSLNRVIALARIAQSKSPRMVYTGTRYSQLMNDTAADAAQTAAARRSNLWATIAGSRDDADSDGNGPGFRARATEFQLGVDRAVSDNTVIGLSLGKSDGKVDVDDRSAEGDLDTFSIGAYARHETDSFYVSGQLSYSRHDIDSERFTGIGDANADFDARTLALQAEIGQRHGRGRYSIEPNINLHYANTKQDSFSESGPGGLSVGSSSYNTRRLGIGVRIVNRDATARLRPYLSVGYQREFGDTKAELTNSLGGGLTAFGVDGTDLGKNIWTLRLGADARINDRFSIVGEIGASWRKNQDSRYLYGGVKYGW